MIVKRLAKTIAMLTVGGLVSVSAVSSAVAQPLPEVVNREESEDDSSRQGLPGRRIGGGTRTDSIFRHEGEALLALTAPEPLTITTAAYPEMLFHIPEMKTDNSAEFVLLDASGEVIYEKVFVAERASDIISVDTADIEGASPIGLDEDYEWYFSLVPDAADRANDVVVHGSIRRVDPSEWLSQQSSDAQIGERIAIADPLSQAQILYKEANLWHDAALLLNELRQNQPEDSAIASEWSQLLDAAKLSNIAKFSLEIAFD